MTRALRRRRKVMKTRSIGRGCRLWGPWRRRLRPIRSCKPCIGRGRSRFRRRPGTHRCCWMRKTSATCYARKGCWNWNTSSSWSSGRRGDGASREPRRGAPKGEKVARLRTSAPRGVEAPANWPGGAGPWGEPPDDLYQTGDSACEPFHGYAYGTTEKINKGLVRNFPGLSARVRAANKGVSEECVRFRAFLGVQNHAESCRIVPKADKNVQKSDRKCRTFATDFIKT